MFDISCPRSIKHLTSENKTTLYEDGKNPNVYAACQNQDIIRLVIRNGMHPWRPKNVVYVVCRQLTRFLRRSPGSSCIPTDWRGKWRERTDCPLVLPAAGSIPEMSQHTQKAHTDVSYLSLWSLWPSCVFAVSLDSTHVSSLCPCLRAGEAI